MNVIVTLPHPRSGDSQGQEMFLASSGDKQTRNYDIECSNHHPSLSTLRPKGLSRIYIYILYIQISIYTDLYRIKTSPLICSANQWTGFYMIEPPS